MIKSILVVKEIINIILNTLAVILVIGNHLIPINKYEWTKDPNLSGTVNSDAVLVIIILSVLSLIFATIAFLLKHKFKSIAFLVYIILIILNIYELIKVIPFYSG
jgi:uncharacterized membrane protein